MKTLLFPHMLSLALLISMFAFSQKNNASLASYSFDGHFQSKNNTAANAILYNGEHSINEFQYEKNAIFFDGIEDYVKLPPFDYSERTEQAISIWIKMIYPDKEFSLVSFSNTKGRPWNQYEVYYKNRELFYLVRNYANDEDITKITYDFPIRSWTHIFVQKTKNGDLSLYINGEIKATTKASKGFCQMKKKAELLIGARIEKGVKTQHFGGFVDNIELFNRSLTDVEIRSIYLKGLNNQILFTLNQKEMEKDSSGFIHYFEDETFLDYYWIKETAELLFFNEQRFQLIDLKKMEPLPSITKKTHHLKDKISKESKIKISPDGKLLAIGGKECKIIIYSLEESKITKTIKINSKLKNYKNALRNDFLKNPFVFISNHELLIGGNFNAQITNLATGQHTRIKLTDESPCIEVCSNMLLTKINDQGQYILYDLKKNTKKWGLAWENLSCPHQITQSCIKDETIMQTNKKDFYLQDMTNPLAENDNHIALKIEGLYELFKISDSNYYLGIREKNKGFVIINGNQNYRFYEEKMYQELIKGERKFDIEKLQNHFSYSSKINEILEDERNKY